jgi:hypothetical protein
MSIPGIIGVKPIDSKVVRVASTTAAFEAGQVWLPQTRYCNWIEDWINEVCSFPNGSAHDDRLDSMSYSLDHLAKNARPYQQSVPLAPICLDRKSPFGVAPEGSIWDVIDGNRPNSLQGMGTRKRSMYDLMNPTYA